MTVLAAPPQPADTTAGPYVGLTFFTEDKAAMFFGRESERKVLIGNLRASRLTLLYAGSGVGKSSLLRAGVAARLGELAERSVRELGTPRNIPVVFSSWRDDPTQDLIEEIGRAASPFLAAEASVPAGGRLINVLNATNEATNATVLVILDQFEEYFLYRTRESREGRFAEELSECLNSRDLRANFLISIREDAYSRLGDLFGGRIANVYGNYLHLENLNRAQAREAIERPVERFNEIHGNELPVTVERELVDAVLVQLAPDQFASDQAGRGTLRAANGSARKTDAIAAPYLQLVMKRLWETELADGSRELRLDTLKHLGDAQTIVNTHVDRALSDLSADEREIALDVFHHLVTPSGTKIAMKPLDLAGYCGHSPEDIELILERLASGDTRIVRPVPPPPDGDGATRYEISHDLLAQAILDWRTRQQAIRLEAQKRVAEEERRTAEIEQRAAEERALAAQRRARIFRGLAIVTGALLIIGVALALVDLAHRADVQRNIAASGHLATSAEAILGRDPELATLLSLQALKVSNTSAAQKALRDALPLVQVTATLAPPPPQRSAMFSSNGSHILTASADGAIRIFDAGSQHQIVAFPGFGAVNSAALNRAGTELVTAGDDGTARIIGARTGRLLGVLAAPGGSALSSAAFSPSGRLVVTAGADGVVRLWDTRTDRQRLAITDENDSVVLDAQFSPNGQRIVTAGNSTVRIWDATTGKSLYSLSDSLGLGPLSASFSPNGREVVSTNEDGSADLWNAADGTKITQLSAPAGQAMLFTAAFSPDGKQLVTAGGGGVIRIWSVASHKLIRSLAPIGDDTIMAASYSPDGKSIVTASAGGTVRVWDSATGNPTAALAAAGTTNRLDSVAFSPDGRLAVTGSHFGVLTVWQASNSSSGRAIWKTRSVIAIPENDAVNGLAFTDNGAGVATANQSGNAYVWSVPSGAFVESIPVSGQPLHSVQFDPVRPTWLLTAGDDGYARIFNAESGNQIGQSMGNAVWPMQDATFSPNGQSIATASNDGYARIWRASDQKQIGSKIGNGNIVLTSVSFNASGTRFMTTDTNGDADVYSASQPQRGYIDQVSEPGTGLLSSGAWLHSGDLLATAGSEGTARIWDSNGENLLVSLAGHQGPINALAVSPTGNELITASVDGTAKVWATQPIEQRVSLPGTTDVNTVAYSPTNPHLLATMTADGSVRLWNLRAPTRPVILHAPTGSSNGYASAAFSHDGRFIVATGGNQQVRVWSLADPARPPMVLDLNKHPNCTNANGNTAAGINNVEFSPDGNRIVTSDTDGSACVWNAHTGVPVLRLIEPAGASAGVTGVSGIGGSGIRWAAFSPDSRELVTASDDGTARIWNAGTGALLQVFMEPSGEAINTVWFSPGGGRIVTADNDGTSRIWDVATGRELETLAEPDHSVVSNANFSPDQRYVVTCTGSVHIWDANDGQLLTSFQYGNDLQDCEFNDNGTEVAAAGYGGATRIFSTELAGSVQQLERLARERVTRQLTPAERKLYGIS